MKKYLIILSLMVSAVCSAQTATSDIWLNEFHYDEITQRGRGDSSEFIELVVRSMIVSNPAELAKYKVVLYTSGALDGQALTLGRGLPYNVSSSWYSEAETIINASTFQQCPVSNSGFTLLYKRMPVL